MNLFQKKAQHAAVPPAPAPASPLEIAECDVHSADGRIAEISRSLRELVERYQIRVDRAGNIAFAVVPDVSFRAELETMVRRNLRERDEALGEFYKALSIWSGLKPGN